MRVGIIGINHKLADLQLRELLAKACQRRFNPQNSTHPDHSLVLLSTCNRTEVYFSSEDLAATHTYLLGILRNEVEQDFAQKLYSYFGHDCFFHLARVTTGLDSAIIGETEIQGQVKVAYESSGTYQKLPFELHYIFQKALKIGKKIRSELPIKSSMPDIEHAIYNTGMHMFKKQENTKILFVGASSINKKIIHFFKTRKLHDITICNRSLDSANSLAHLNQIQILDWDQLSLWPDFDWIILSTKSPIFLISPHDLPKQMLSKKLIMDLSVPRNVEPNMGRHTSITLLNIDQINRTLKIRKQRMNHFLYSAEKIVTYDTRQHIQIFHNRQSSSFRSYAVSA
jgi:glutamyl-tRNA reductase